MLKSMVCAAALAFAGAITAAGAVGYEVVYPPSVADLDRIVVGETGRVASAADALVKLSELKTAAVNLKAAIAELEAAGGSVRWPVSAAGLATIAVREPDRAPAAAAAPQEAVANSTADVASTDPPADEAPARARRHRQI